MARRPRDDDMQARLEKFIRVRLAALPELDVIRVFYRGEIGQPPLRLWPFFTLYLSGEREATGEDGYRPETGYRFWRYDGYAACDVAYKDAVAMEPDNDRFADSVSYIEAKELAQAMKGSLMDWDPWGQQVTSADGKNVSDSIFMGEINNGITDRGNNNFTNRGTVRFRIYTREVLF